MKKNLLVLIFAIVAALGLAIPRAHAETITYTPTYLADHSYNLDTGIYYSDANWDCTGKILLLGDNLTLSTTTAHHLLFWDDANIYLGYYNVAASSDYQGSMWLGDYAAPFTPPTGADRFAIVGRKTNHDTQIAIGASTYSDIFENPLYLEFETEYMNGAVPYTLDNIFTPAVVSVSNIGYSKANLDAQTAEWNAEGITTLSLTNLIQNGRFSTDSNTDGLADNWSGSGGGTRVATLTDGVQKYTQTGSGSLVMGQNVSLSTVAYYIRGITSKSGFGGVGLNVYHGGTFATFVSNIDTAVSAIFTPATSATAFYIGNVSTLSPGAYLLLDDISLFTSGSYTKTQIDAALTWSGYLPYNTAYSLPDTTDADFANLAGTGSCSDGVPCYTIRGSGIGTALELYDYFETISTWYFTESSYGDPSNAAMLSFFDEWRSIYAKPGEESGYLATINGLGNLLFPLAVMNDFIDDTAKRDYYLDLYWDAIAETPDRWEWYQTYGVTSSNYAALLATYNFLATNYSVVYDTNDLNDITFTSTRPDETPVVVKPWVDSIEDWFTDTLNLGDYGDFPFVLLAILITVAVVVILALFHAPGIVIMIFGILALIFFVIVGWFPFWLALVVILGLIGFLFFTKRGGA